MKSLVLLLALALCGCGGKGYTIDSMGFAVGPEAIAFDLDLHHPNHDAAYIAVGADDYVY